VPDWRGEEARARGVFREVNDRIVELEDTFAVDGPASFVCECGNLKCTAAIELTRAEYEEVRAHPRRFVIARDHENPEVEIVVSHNGTWAVVETLVGDQ
jgi:hypothetical protein